MKKVKGNERYKLPLISHGDVTYSSGNIVNNIVINLMI